MHEAAVKEASTARFYARWGWLVCALRPCGFDGRLITDRADLAAYYNGRADQWEELAQEDHYAELGGHYGAGASLIELLGGAVGWCPDNAAGSLCTGGAVASAFIPLPGAKFRELKEILESKNLRRLFDIPSISERGTLGEKLLGPNNLGRCFKTFDCYDIGTRTATSIKTLDLEAYRYAVPSGLESKLNEYLRAVQDFRPTGTKSDSPFGKGFVLDPSDIAVRRLDIAIPAEITATQYDVLQAAIDRGLAGGVDGLGPMVYITYVVVPGS